MSAFTAEQLQALSVVFLRLNGAAFNTHLVFFGVWCLLIGCLIFRSTFLPRVLGVLLAIAGLGWMIYLLPPIASRLFPFIAAASALGEIPLELWLIVMAVNDQRWREHASAAAAAMRADSHVQTLKITLRNKQELADGNPETQIIKLADTALDPPKMRVRSPKNSNHHRRPQPNRLTPTTVAGRFWRAGSGLRIQQAFGWCG